MRCVNTHARLGVCRLAVVGLAWCGAQAAEECRSATVLLDIRPEQERVDDVINVETGEVVPFEVTSTVVADDPFTPDTAGLASFQFDIVSNLGVPQAPIQAFDPFVDPLFPENRTVGTVVDDDVIGIGASQFGTTPTPGVALDETQVLSRGEILTPTTPGTFRVQVDGQAEVFSESEPLVVRPATVEAGSGFLVRVNEDLDEEEDNGLGDNDEDADDEGTEDDRFDRVDDEIDEAEIAGEIDCAPMSTVGMLGLSICLMALRFGYRRQ
jgi:hypothetical protein